MVIPQYHGKVYYSERTGCQYTKGPYGTVLFKHPVIGPKVWTPSQSVDSKLLDALIWLEEVK